MPVTSVVKEKSVNNFWELNIQFFSWGFFPNIISQKKLTVKFSGEFTTFPGNWTVYLTTLVLEELLR